MDGAKYAHDVQDIVNYGTCGHVAGFVAEAIQVINTTICQYYNLSVKQYEALILTPDTVLTRIRCSYYLV